MFASLLSPLMWKAFGAAVVLAVIGGAVTWWSVHEYNAGYAKAIADIAAKDKEAVDAVNAAKTKVDECYSRTGDWEWDSTRGLCRAR